MKRLCILLLLCLMLCACGKEEEPVTQLANPWKDYATLQEAEEAASLTCPLPVEMAAVYTADTFRVLEDSLLEVTYRAEEEKVTLRIRSGEEADISGVHSQFEKTEEIAAGSGSGSIRTGEAGVLILLYRDGINYSVFAPDGFRPGGQEAFVAGLLG